MFERFTDRSRRAIVLAQESARSFGHPYIGTEHLLVGLLQEGDGAAGSILTSAGITAEGLSEAIARVSPPPASAAGVGNLPFTPRAKRSLEMSLREALHLGHAYISTEHLLLGLLSSRDETFIELLRVLGVTPDSIRQAVYDTLSDSSASLEVGPQDSGQVRASSRSSSRTPGKMLEQYGKNMTELALQGAIDPVIGRAPEIERVMQVLCRRTKNNPVLIGEPGVGKTAVVEGLALRIAAGEVPQMLAGTQLYSLDLASMVAGTRYRGDFEERVKKLIAEVLERDDVVLFLDELHMLAGAGAAEGSIDASSILKPLMARGKLRIIGATTTDEYRKNVEKDAALERRFQSVMVEAPSVEETVKILLGLRATYEKFHRVSITDEALEKAAELSDRYIADRQLPDKAIDLVDEAGARLRILPRESGEVSMLRDELKAAVDAKADAAAAEEFELAQSLRTREKELAEKLDQLLELAESDVATAGVVDGSMIAEIVSAWTGVPVTALDAAESLRLLNLEEGLHARIVGQDPAVRAVARAIRRNRSGLGDPHRPLGSFIFLGPSGVGKTELAKTLAELLFDDGRALIQLDMSEYMEAHTVSRLIGSPPGYVGHDEGGQLTEAVRRRPYSVVLFDEVEKAHPDVFNVLLQLLEEGQVTDAQGRKVTFRNTLVILTSNLGTASLGAPQVGFVRDTPMNVYDTMRDRVQDALKRHFRPELLNRIDETVVFAPLTLDEVEEIVDLLLRRVRDQLAERQVTLLLSPEVRRWLSEQGYDPQLGARPLRRAIQRHLEDPLAERLLLGDLAHGGVISVEVSDEQLTFEVLDGAPAELPAGPDLVGCSG